MAAFAVAGTKLQFTVSATLTDIPSVNNVAFSGGERTDINVTAIDNEDELYIGGRRAKQELSFSIFYDPANSVHQAILSNYSASSATAVAMKMIDADAGAAEHTFSAYCKTFSFQRDRDDAAIANVVMVLTTAITTTP